MFLEIYDAYILLSYDIMYFKISISSETKYPPESAETRGYL